MELALSLVFGFMVFMIILTKGRLFFFSITSLIITAAISFGVGYGVALFVLAILGPLLKLLLVFVAVLAGVVLLLKLLDKGGE